MSRKLTPSIKTDQKGFTLLELLIATTVFSVILLLCAYGLLQIGRVYYKGLSASKTQETARAIMDEISRAIQFSGSDISGTPAMITRGVPYVFCIDGRRYSAVTDRQLKNAPTQPTQSRNVLLVDDEPGCTAATTPQALTSPSMTPEVTSRELVAHNMRLGKLEVVPLADNKYSISVRVISGDDDLLTGDGNPTHPEYHQRCADIRAGSQFCAMSELNTVVQKRL